MLSTDQFMDIALLHRDGRSLRASADGDRGGKTELAAKEIKILGQDAIDPRIDGRGIGGAGSGGENDDSRSR